MNYTTLANFYITYMLGKFRLIQKGDKFFFRYIEGKIILDTPITTSFEKLLKFIDLDVATYTADFKCNEEVFDFIISSKFFDRYEMLEMNTSTLEKETKDAHEEFCQYMNHVEAKGKFRFPANHNLYLHVVDAAFPEVDLKKQVYERYAEGLRGLQPVDKFSYNLILNWYPELAGRGDVVAALINEFVKSIQHDKNGERFDHYLERRTPNEVREDFCVYVDLHMNLDALLHTKRKT